VKSKLNICAARRPGMTHSQYSRYLRDNHARLVLGTEPVARYLAAYVQQHVYDASYGPDAPAVRYDSVSHLFALSFEEQMAATATREYKEIIAPDESNFADPRSPMFLRFEEVALPLPLRGVSSLRLLHYLRARPGVDATQFQSRWAAAHEALLAESPSLFNGVRRAVLNKSLPFPTPDAPAPAYTAMAELGFLQTADAAAMDEYVQRIEEKLDELIQRAAGFYLLAEAVAVRGALY
jgi:hypothetical protein